MESAESQQATLAEAFPGEKELLALVKAYYESKYIQFIIHHQPASEPVDDYITDFETRCQLFTKFLKCTASSNFFNPELAIKDLDSTVFALVMVAPIGILQKALSDQRHRDAWVISFFGIIHSLADFIVKHCKPGFSAAGRVHLDDPNAAPTHIEFQKEGAFAMTAVLPLASTPRDLRFFANMPLIRSANCEIIILVFLPACAIQWRPI